MNQEVFSLDGVVEQIIRNTLVEFKIIDTVVIPFQKAIVSIMLLDIAQEGKVSATYVMEGYDYEQWGGDDEYLINWIRRMVKMQFGPYQGIPTPAQQ